METKKYMIAILGTRANWKRLSEAERKSIMGLYRDFSSGLVKNGQMVDGSELVGGTYGLQKRGGQVVVDGPFAESKEVLGGYYIVNATSIENAIELAKGCPALTYGDRLEVSVLD